MYAFDVYTFVFKCVCVGREYGRYLCKCVWVSGKRKKERGRMSVMFAHLVDRVDFNQTTPSCEHARCRCACFFPCLTHSVNKKEFQKCLLREFASNVGACLDFND